MGSPYWQGYWAEQAQNFTNMFFSLKSKYLWLWLCKGEHVSFLAKYVYSFKAWHDGAYKSSQMFCFTTQCNQSKTFKKRRKMPWMHWWKYCRRFLLQGVSYWNVLFELALRGRRINNFVELLCIVASGGLEIWVFKTSF